MIHPTSKGSPSNQQPSPANDARQGNTPRKSRSSKKSKSLPSTKDMILLDPDFQPGKQDVICSRGKFAYNSPGNCLFRTLVEEQMDNYANARTKTDKSLVVSILVNRVRQTNSEGGFVKNIGGRWYRVSERYSREKVGQQFRDLLHTKYRSSTKAKAEKRKRQQHDEWETSASSFEESASYRSYSERRSNLSQFSSPDQSPPRSFDKTKSTDSSCAGGDVSKVPSVDLCRASKEENREVSHSSDSVRHSIAARKKNDENTVDEAPLPALVVSTKPHMPLQPPPPPQLHHQNNNNNNNNNNHHHLEYDGLATSMDIDFSDFEPLPIENTNAITRDHSSLTLNYGSGFDDSFPNFFGFCSDIQAVIAAPPGLTSSLETSAKQDDNIINTNSNNGGIAGNRNGRAADNDSGDDDDGELGLDPFPPFHSMHLS